jgi:hypothetical protein
MFLFIPSVLCHLQSDIPGEETNLIHPTLSTFLHSRYFYCRLRQNVRIFCWGAAGRVTFRNHVSHSSDCTRLMKATAVLSITSASRSSQVRTRQVPIVNICNLVLDVTVAKMLCLIRLQHNNVSEFGFLTYYLKKSNIHKRNNYFQRTALIVSERILQIIQYNDQATG